MWFTPPRSRLSPASAAFLGTGTRAGIRVNGRNVATWSWGEGPTVILMHGWGGLAAQLESFVEPLVRAGYRAVAFDAPSHGASGPSSRGKRQVTLFDFTDALIEVSRAFDPVVAVIAHSGGCTSVGWAMRHGWTVPAAVFLAPMASPITYRKVFGQALGVSDAVLDRFASNVEHDLKFKWEDLVLTTVSRAVDTPPVLIVHDRDDRETFHRESVEIAAQWPDARLRTTTGLGHRRILREPAIVNEVMEFVLARTRSAEPVLLRA